MRPGGRLEVVNVGDSGLRLVRGGAVAWASGVQEHTWNCPYQLSHPALFPQTDTVADAAVSELELRRGDVLVAGSDGLFDNLWEEELLGVVAAAGGGGSAAAAAQRQAEALAESLVRAASANAGNKKYRGPWAVELEQNGKVRLFVWWRCVERAAADVIKSHTLHACGEPPRAVFLQTPTANSLQVGTMGMLFGARGGKVDDITAVVAIVA
jgi:hypothetical protein